MLREKSEANRGPPELESLKGEPLKTGQKDAGREKGGSGMQCQESESESRSVMSDSLLPHGLHGPWNSPGQNIGVGSLSFLQGIFPTQGSNPGLLHCRQILYQLSHKGSPIYYLSMYNIYAPSSFCVSFDGHLQASFMSWLLLSSAVVNTGVHVSFQISFCLFRVCAQEWIARSYGNSIFSI